MTTHVLKTPITHDGRTIRELQLDFSKVQGRDLIEVERAVDFLMKDKKQGKSPVAIFNTEYQACVAARAALLPVDVIFSLSGSDFTQICLLTLNYLLGVEGNTGDEAGHGDADIVITIKDIKTASEFGGYFRGI